MQSAQFSELTACSRMPEDSLRLLCRHRIRTDERAQYGAGTYSKLVILHCIVGSRTAPYRRDWIDTSDTQPYLVRT